MTDSEMFNVLECCKWPVRWQDGKCIITTLNGDTPPSLTLGRAVHKALMLQRDQTTSSAALESTFVARTAETTAAVGFVQDVMSLSGIAVGHIGAVVARQQSCNRSRIIERLASLIGAIAERDA